MIGTSVAGRYEIEEQIGIGGMGIVYRAYDTRLRRHVALKVIAPHLVQQEAARSQFLREAQALAGLMHPNIVTVFDLCEDEEPQTVFIVMELLRGRSLRHCMTDSDRPLFSQVALPLCRALEAAHVRGVLHRDIKPENVFVCDDGTIKLMDFGLARLLTANSRSQASLLAGTLAYMAPEQLKGEPADFRADLYSLGILLYECLSGVTPFEADNPGAVLLKHLTEAAPPLHSHVPDIAPELESTILRLLEKEPAARFASATALREALEHPMAGSVLPVIYAADKTLPAPHTYSAPTLRTVRTDDTPTPVLPPQAADRMPEPISAPLRHTIGRVEPAFLIGGIACFGAATLLFVGPVHRLFAATNSAEASSPAQKRVVPAVASSVLTQQAGASPTRVLIAGKQSNSQNQSAKSQAHASAALDELIKQQEQTRTEVERLEKLMANAEAKRKTAETRAAAAEAAVGARTHAAESHSGSATDRWSAMPGWHTVPVVPGMSLAPQSKTRPAPLPPGLPDALVKIASLHPHDPFDFRTRPVTRTPDGTIQVQVHNSRLCYVYFYLLADSRNEALLLPNGERRLAGIPQRSDFASIGLRLDEPGVAPSKLLLLASAQPLFGLPSSFPLPAVPPRSAADVSIDRRFALLHEYRDQIVTTLQTNRVLLDGKNLRQDDLIVRFLRYKPAAAGASPSAPPPPGKYGRQRADANGTGTPQIASIPVEPFQSKDAL